MNRRHQLQLLGGRFKADIIALCFSNVLFFHSQIYFAKLFLHRAEF